MGLRIVGLDLERLEEFLMGRKLSAQVNLTKQTGSISKTNETAKPALVKLYVKLGLTTFGKKWLI